MKLISNINFTGKCEEAFNFYAQALGWELSEFNRYSAMPSDPNQPLPEEYKDQIMHVSISKGGEMILMWADIIPGMAPYGFVVGTNLEICIMTDTKEEADKVFANLSEGGRVSMPMEDQFWGDYFWSCSDKYGIGWMILCPGVQ